VYGFDRAVRFYEGMDDRDGLDLIKTCVYLRLSGYPGPRHPEETDPNRDILNRLRKRWDWSQYEGDRTESYAQWTEDERLAIENRILGKLWSLFSMVASVAEKQKEGAETDPRDLDALRSRVEKRLTPKPGQIPYASTYLRARRKPSSLRVVRQRDPAGGDSWAVIDQGHPGSGTDKPLLFYDPQLPRIVGWICLNGLYTPKPSLVVFHHLQSAIAEKRAEAFLKEVHRFFHMEKADRDFRSKPVWENLLVVLDLGLGPKQRSLGSAGFLIQNTWGEMFFFPMDLTRVENNLLRCYEIAKGVWQVQGSSLEGRFKYLIYHSRTIEDAQAAKKIEEFIGSFRNDNFGKPVP
jgi:adenylate cyclase